MLRGRTLALSVLLLTSAVGYMAFPGLGSGEDPHAPIHIDGDADFSACSCVRSGSGTPSDPLVIAGWRIDNPRGAAIQVENVRTTHFVIRDNILSGKLGVHLAGTGDRGEILSNEISHESRGVRIDNSSPLVQGNFIQGPANSVLRWSTTGVWIRGGSPTIDDNMITRTETGIRVITASATIEDNELVQNGDAVVVSDSSQAVLRGNIIRLADHWGLVVHRSAEARLIDNEIREGKGGIIVHSATLYMESNTVINQRQEAVHFQASVVTMFRNNITDNWRGAYGSTDSDVLLKENTFTNNRDAGVRLIRSEGTIEDNKFELNGIGIDIVDSIITLKGNEMNHNDFGLSIPYSSRQSIPLMEGNFINGVNVDGTVNPADKRIYYMAAGATISGKTIDSGHNAGFFGTTMKQGALLIYDSVDVTIEQNDFAYNQRAILIVNSTFVTVRNNTFTNNQEGVVTQDSRTFIKENECIIEIDPPQTICFEASGGFVAIRTNVVANVEVGIRFNAGVHVATRGVIEANVVSNTQVGIRAEGTVRQNEHDVLVLHNEVRANVVGMELSTFRGTLEANVLANNTWAAAHLEGRTNATFEANVVIDNGAGLIDVGDCSDGWTNRCSTGVFVENRIEGNAGVGIELHNGGRFEGDIITDNRVGLEVQGTAVLERVNVTHNERVGARIEGTAIVQGGNVTHNGRVGLLVRGTLSGQGTVVAENGGNGLEVHGHAILDGGASFNNSGDGIEVQGIAHIAGASFTGNGEAGLHLEGRLFRVTECEASFNVHGVIIAEALVEVHVGIPSLPDIPDIEQPQIPDVTLPDFDDEEETDPLWLNSCNIEKNSQFALRANANAVVNATFNYWGPDGPRLDIPLVPRSNTIEAAALLTPYWLDRNHTEFGVVPTTAVGPDVNRGDASDFNAQNQASGDQAEGNRSAGIP